MPSSVDKDISGAAMTRHPVENVQKTERARAIATALPEEWRQGSTVDAWVQALSKQDDNDLTELETRLGLKGAPQPIQRDDMSRQEKVGRIVAAARKGENYGRFNSLDDLQQSLKTADNTALETVYTAIAVPYEQSTRTERKTNAKEEQEARKRLIAQLGGNQLTYAKLEEMIDTSGAEATKLQAKLEQKDQELQEQQRNVSYYKNEWTNYKDTFAKNWESSMQEREKKIRSLTENKFDELVDIILKQKNKDDRRDQDNHHTDPVMRALNSFLGKVQENYKISWDNSNKSSGILSVHSIKKKTGK
jgi:hypothetical protein